ncbi:Uncharacterized conserved protein YndB, AHSA1/START domain [Haloechinothrix alba]|uniref:Uncharacterized conserved protein YndB, AHSA1/START domain n=1 Tax=Haloechinothrix alba TaxID=664784 RepID=A0A238Y0T6_9PSEU|nr:SRPBCC family protein [Haloechinothrix alba]SNR64582.1 Uncharacterized conserved protein YndB, AHSA1/START domain [Haloechinothrix alba]
MTATGSEPGSRQATSERETVISRTIGARRELVFEAFTDIDHLARWWGPDGFTTTTTAFEFREGGEWTFVMHGPDGTDYANWIRWREIVRPERIRFVQGQSPDDPDAFETTVTFEDNGDATGVCLRTEFPTRELRDRAVQRYGAIEGGRQTLGRLATYVAGPDS